jgi:hypothetical protein
MAAAYLSVHGQQRLDELLWEEQRFAAAEDAQSAAPTLL